MRNRKRLLPLILSLCLLAALGALLAASATARSPSAPAAELHVCPTLQAGCDHTSIQGAVDAAAPGSVVKVAAGTYADWSVREGMTQSVRIDKALTLQGGYTPDDWTTSLPDANPTIVDAQGQGATFLVEGATPITVEGLHLTGAGPTSGFFADWSAGLLASESEVTLNDCAIYDNHSGVLLWMSTASLNSNTIFSNTLDTYRPDGGAGVGVWRSTAILSGNTIRDNTVQSTETAGGGGVYVYYSNVTLAGNTIAGNVGNATGVAQGGGIYLEYSEGTLTGNTIASNTATLANGSLGYGGGVYLVHSAVALDDNVIEDNIASDAPGANGDGGGVNAILSDGTTLTRNRIEGNVASSGSFGGGGGILIDSSQITLTANLIAGNYATASPLVLFGKGGGLALEKTTLEWRTLTLVGNRFIGNVASVNGSGDGGGLYLGLGEVQLFDNQIEDNVASTGTTGYGGGIYRDSGGRGPFVGNLIRGNAASTAGDGYGGGLHLTSADYLVLEGNNIAGNTATTELGATGQGGGIYMEHSKPMTLTNNLVTGNQAHTEGGGIWFDGSPYMSPVRVLLRHNTLADNQGGAQGMHIGDGMILTFTNTIIAGHAATGISVVEGSTVTLEATLWFSNGTDVDGAGEVALGTINLYADPAFAGGGDYHLTALSAARDQGVPAGVATDIDRRLRPLGPAPDLGADEFAYPTYLPLAIK